MALNTKNSSNHLLLQYKIKDKNKITFTSPKKNKEKEKEKASPLLLLQKHETPEAGVHLLAKEEP